MITAVTPYGPAGPSSRVRVYEWLDRIGEPATVSGYVGHRNAAPKEIGRHPAALLAAEARLRRMAAGRPERLLLHREASPLSRGGIERRLIESASFSAYDFDDALQWDRGEGGIFRRLAPKATKALIGATLADRVIAGNEILADWASDHAVDVVIIPSCVDPGRYERKTDYAVADPPRIGWIGSADNEAYLTGIASALWEVNRKTGARVTLIGTASRTLGELEAIIDRVPWSEPVQYTALAGFDVGLAPLTDEPYTRGKCGYKILQYAAAGTPVVASPVGVNRKILAELGMPAATGPDDWHDALLDLIGRSTEARRTAGARERTVIEENYSFAAWSPRWRAAMGVGG